MAKDCLRNGSPTYQSLGLLHKRKRRSAIGEEPLFPIRGREYSCADDSRSGAMRPLLAFLLVAFALAACSNPRPPTGRWEGAYDDGTTFIAARLEIGADGFVRVSAPDVVDPTLQNEADKAQMRQNMAQRLAGGWGEVAPRKMDFDGKTFRKPGGIAPQIEWDPSAKTMTIYAYIGTRPAIRIPLHVVDDFTSDPWAH
jgi:hypothetical protein